MTFELEEGRCHSRTEPGQVSSPSPADEALPNVPAFSSIENISTEFTDEMNQNVNKRYHDKERNAWFPDVERYMVCLGEECLRYSLMHQESSKLDNKRFQLITVSLIIVPIISGTMTLLPFGITITKIAVGIISLISVALGSINKMMNFNAKAQLHRISGNKYMKLQGQISEQMSLPIHVRYNGVAFERFCRNVFFNIKELAPYLEKKSSKKIVAIPSILRPPLIASGNETVVISMPENGESLHESSVELEQMANPRPESEQQYQKYMSGRKNRHAGVFMADSPGS